MKEEKNLHELSDEMLGDVSGGMFEALSQEELEPYYKYHNKLLEQYYSNEISQKTFNELSTNAAAYYGYVRLLSKAGKHNETILFDESVNWLDKYYELMKRGRP